MTEARNPVKSVRTTARILRALKELDSAGVTELSERLGLTKGTVHNHLSTLEENEFVVRDGEKYRLGILFFEFGEQTKRAKKIYGVGVPEVEKLADRTDELASLLIEEHGRGIYLHRARGEQALTLDTRIGARVYLHNTGLGKAILAHLPRERTERILDRHGLPRTTENTIDSRDALFEELDRVRERGYAIDDEERATGIRCVAAPVTTSDGAVHGAVSVAGPTSRIKGDRLETAIPDLVQNAANVISINLTYS
ncbi:IclR family transcriptional regulator [Halegenticoccus soli]|uniref:IclR family transcriptional regulator n=1 Tax=Halegenticoccus soli TaxID=1985678 RepID=UPI000C6EBB8B|nr:IclR family transcriptional regulator [Halegenticoccus soli]